MTRHSTHSTRPRLQGAAARPAPFRTIVATEWAKLRGLRLLPVAGLLLFGVVGLTVWATIGSADFADPRTRDWRAPLAGVSFAIGLVSPLLIAITASRLVDIEHRGRGWLLNATNGIGAGTLCRAKFCIGALILSTVTLLTHLAILLLGRALGIDVAVPVGLWGGFAISALVVGLVVLASQLVVSAMVENQLIGLGIGVIGTVLATFASGLPTWFNHLTPGATGR